MGNLFTVYGEKWIYSVWGKKEMHLRKGETAAEWIWVEKI